MYYTEIGGCFAVLREGLYRLLGYAAASFFHGLNLLMGGNLPPFGSVYVVVREQGRYLLLEQMDGTVVLPGGFMRWHEKPPETGRRECEEETGIQVRVGEMVECFSCPATAHSHMSTLALIYRAEVSGGSLRHSIEGRPRWFSESEARQRLARRCQPFFESYLRFSQRRTPETPPEHEEARSVNP